MPHQEYLCLAKALHKHGHYWEAQIHNKTAVMLLRSSAGYESEHVLKAFYYAKYFYCLPRSRYLDFHFDTDKFKLNGHLIEVIQIVENTYNYNYTEIFRKYCNEHIKEIVIYESVMSEPGDFGMLRKLIKHLQRRCVNAKFIKLKCEVMRPSAIAAFKKELLTKYDIDFDAELHLPTSILKPKLIFSTGIVFIFDQGLTHFTYRQRSKFSKCKATKNRIEVWHSNDMFH